MATGRAREGVRVDICDAMGVDKNAAALDAVSAATNVRTKLKRMSSTKSDDFTSDIAKMPWPITVSARNPSRREPKRLALTHGAEDYCVR